MNRIIALFCLAAAAGSTSGQALADGEINRGIGEKADVGVPLASGRGREVLESVGERKATVIVFTGVGCPIGNLYLPRLNDLSSRYESKGVAFLAVDANEGRTERELGEQAKEFGVAFPMSLDGEGGLARSLQAERTCEALVIDGQGVLRYRGAIDDQYGLGTAKEAPDHHFLVEAIEAVLAGGDLDTTATSVVGCPIERRVAVGFEPEQLAEPERVQRLIGQSERVRAPGGELRAAWAEFAPDEDALIDEAGEVTWAGEVASIVQTKCAGCHRSGEVGPFPLTTFDEVTKRLKGIGEVVDLRRMPPWHADPRYGHFANDRSLSPRERAAVLAWIERGAPAGDLAAAPSGPEYAQGWTIGQPDLVIQMEKPYAVKDQGVERYQHFSIPLNLTEDVWIQAAEARPSDRSVVHHIIAYLVPPGQRGPDIRRGHLCGYAPGDMPSVYPDGTAKKIPAGSSILLEVHYTPIGQIRMDQSSVGFVFARKPIEREAITVGISNEGIRIPPETADYAASSRMALREPMRLLSFMPHMHLRGRSFEYFATRADGSTERLLSVPAFDFGWQSYYTLREPIELKPGDRIDCVARYDNSAGNPLNPNPSKRIGWGDQTWEEMMIGFVDVSMPLAEKVDPTVEPNAAE